MIILTKYSRRVCVLQTTALCGEDSAVRQPAIGDYQRSAAVSGAVGTMSEQNSAADTVYDERMNGSDEAMDPMQLDDLPYVVLIITIVIERGCFHELSPLVQRSWQ